MKKLLPLFLLAGCGGSQPVPVDPPFVDSFPGVYDGTFFVQNLNESGTITISVSGDTCTVTAKNDTLGKTATAKGEYFLHPSEDKWRMCETSWIYKGSTKKQPFECVFVMLGNGAVRGHCALDDGDVQKTKIVFSPVDVYLTKR